MRQKVAGKFIFSGLFKTAVHMLSGFVILRWLNPEELGTWQSFTVFVGYLQILTLGTTSGLNRELPYYLGKGEGEAAIQKLKAGGYYTTVLSVGLMISTTLVGFFLWLFNYFSLEFSIMFVFAFSTAALSIQTNFLGATFRASNSFVSLTKIQLLNAGLYILLIPLIYFFGIWGFISYQILLALFLYLGYYIYRPYRVKYSYNFKEIIELVKVGLPIYVWNYLSQIIQSIPRTILVLFGSPYIVGLYSPAGSINGAMINLPAYTNRYLFPKMSYNYGKNNDKVSIFNYAKKAAATLFIVMFVSSIVLALLIPPVFSNLFPKYIDGIIAAQITIFTGVLYSINSIFHNTLNSIKEFKPFKFIVGIRFLFIIFFTYISWIITKNILISVAMGSVLAEFFNVFSYYYFLRKSCRKH